MSSAELKPVDAHVDARVDPRVDPIQGDILHVYDGIEEADNQLPMWWLWTFFLAIIFAACYWLYFEAFAFSPGPLDEYKAERLAAMDTGEPVTEEELLAMVADPGQLKDGSVIFARSCARCHGARGEGAIGPNLTDPNWIGGGAPLAIFETINRGRAGKGMQAWGPTYGRGGVMQAAAFVLTLRNTNVAGGKAAQGPVWVAPEPPAPEAGSDGGVGEEVDGGTPSDAE